MNKKIKYSKKLKRLKQSKQRKYIKKRKNKKRKYKSSQIKRGGGGEQFEGLQCKWPCRYCGKSPYGGSGKAYTNRHNKDPCICNSGGTLCFCNQNCYDRYIEQIGNQIRDDAAELGYVWAPGVGYTQ